MDVRVHGLAWKVPVLVAVLMIIWLQAAASGSVSARQKRKSALIIIGATVLPYAGKQGKTSPDAALYISRVPGERYY